MAMNNNEIQGVMQDYLNWTLSLLTASDPTDPTTRIWKGGTDSSWCAPTAPLKPSASAMTFPPQVCVAKTKWRDSDTYLINTMLGLGYDDTLQKKIVKDTATNAADPSVTCSKITDETKCNQNHACEWDITCKTNSTYKDTDPHNGYAYFQITEYDPVTCTVIGEPKTCYLEVIQQAPSWVQPPPLVNCANNNSESKCEENNMCRWVANACQDKLYTYQMDQSTVENFTTGQPCSTFTDQTTCQTHDNCTWDNNKCTPKCSTFTNQADCQAQQIDNKLYCAWDNSNQVCNTSPMEYPCDHCSTKSKQDCTNDNVCKWSDGSCTPIVNTCSCQPTALTKKCVGKDTEGCSLTGEAPTCGYTADQCNTNCIWSQAPDGPQVVGLKAHFVSTVAVAGGIIPPSPPLVIFPSKPQTGYPPDVMLFVSDPDSGVPKYYKIEVSNDSKGMTKQANGFCRPGSLIDGNLDDPDTGWLPFDNAPPSDHDTLPCTNLRTLQYVVTQYYTVNNSTQACPNARKECPICYGVGASCSQYQSGDDCTKSGCKWNGSSCTSNCTYGHAPHCGPSSPDDCTAFNTPGNAYFIPFYYFLMNNAKMLNQCCNFNPETDGDNILLKYFCSVRGDNIKLKQPNEQVPGYTLDPNSGMPPPLCDLRMTQLCNDPVMSSSDACSCLQRPNPEIMNTSVYKYLSDTLNVPDTCLTGACDPSTSYVPSTLRNQICPNICSSILQVNSDGFANVEIDGVNMAVWCDQTTGTVSLSSESPVLAAKSSTETPSTNNKWVLYLLVILIVILGILIFFL